MLSTAEVLTEVQANELAARIVQETSRQVKVLSVECPPRGKYWRLRLLLTCRELVQVVESEQAWYSIRGAWNELVPGLVAACMHRWVRLPRSIGLFRCAECAERAVCPGCLNSVMVALVAADAGFMVVWCEAHTTSGSASDEN